MKFRLCVLGIVIIILCIPYIRLFFKRLSLLFKIKRVCRDKGYALRGKHFLWFLGGKEGKNCDCVIETEKELFAVKLFGMPRRKRVLVFKEKKEFFVRILMLLVEGRFFFWIREVFDGKAKPLPEYDFSLKNKPMLSDKKLRKILLVNPVPMEILLQAENSKETILIPGDEVCGMEFANLAWLLKQLM